jgi:hypothetical protein
LLAHGWWFSSGTPASSTTKTGRHDIAEILLKVALNTKNQIESINQQYFSYIMVVSFIRGRNRRTRRKPLTICKQQLRTIT